MADIRKYPGVENPLSQREIIGTIKAVECQRKDKQTGKPTGEKIPAYYATLQLNASDPQTQIASQANPEGGANLNLYTGTYGKDGNSKITHSVFYTKEQGDKMIAAAGKNVAPQLDSKGQPIQDAHVIAFKSDLTISKDNGIVVRTDREMAASDIAKFGKSGKKAQAAFNAQFDAMRQSSEINKVSKQNTASRSVEAPEAAAEAQTEAEADAPDFQ
jgi:hypothetical protein